jgi:hypothetical protein
MVLHTLKLSAVLLLLVASTSVVVAGAPTPGELRSSLGAAYAAVSRAEASGGEVDGLVSKLDEAARLIDSGSEANLGKAQGLIVDVASAASVVGSQGVRSKSIMYKETGVALTTLAALAFLVWRFGSRVFWAAWLRGKRGWRIRSA